MGLIDNLVVQYKMNDNAGNNSVIDLTGSYNGTFVDATGNPFTSAHASTGKINGAFDFDGVDDYIDTGHSFESVFKDSFSLSLWARPDDGTPDAMQLIAGTTHVDREDGVELQIKENGNIQFVYDSEDQNFTARSSVFSFSHGVNDWHHIIVTAENNGSSVNGIKVYVNNELVAISPSNVDFAEYGNANNLYIGCRNLAGVANSFYNGLIDNFMIFNRLINDRERAFLYNGGLGREVLTESFRRAGCVNSNKAVSFQSLETKKRSTKIERYIKKAYRTR